MKELFELFFVFFKMGSVTFGGGYAMLPIIQEEIVNKRNWATNEEILNYYAIGQSTPGIIAVNTATFIGYKRKDIIGGIIATLGIVSPSIVIISLIANIFKNFQEYEVIQHALNGIGVVVAILILNSVIKMYKDSIIDKLTLSFFIIALVVLSIFNINPIYLIISSAIISVLYYKKEAK